MTKRDKILNLFNSKEWIDGLGCGKIKMITYDDFRHAGLSPTIEYGETYCDIIYARNILKKLGYKVLIGSLTFNVLPLPSLPSTEKK